MEAPLRYPTLAEGQVIGDRYRILSLIGEGSMGMVFLAEHVMIKRRVAVKVLHRELSTDAIMVKRFLNEARAASMLGHPNIVQSTDMGITPDNVLYIVFDHIEGTLLTNAVASCNGEMPILRVLNIADQIASALAAAHEAGLVHRDLKSDNIFLSTKNGEADHVTVIDFGISRFLAASHRTGRGTLLGTLEYMAPEQITAPDSVDHRCDIYALGVILYEMLSGQLPFQLSSGQFSKRRMERRIPDLDAAHGVMLQIVQQPPPPLVRFDAPPGLREMIEDKLLAKDRAKRYQSMSEVRAALGAFASVMQVNAVVEADDPDAALALLAQPRTISKSLLDPAWLAQQVESLGARWTVGSDGLRFEIQAPMSRCAAIVTACAEIAEDLAHPPMIAIDGSRMVLTTRTRQVNAITKLDLIFAARLERFLRDHGW